MLTDAQTEQGYAPPWNIGWSLAQVRGANFQVESLGIGIRKDLQDSRPLCLRDLNSVIHQPPSDSPADVIRPNEHMLQPVSFLNEDISCLKLVLIVGNRIVPDRRTIDSGDKNGVLANVFRGNGEFVAPDLIVILWVISVSFGFEGNRGQGF